MKNLYLISVFLSFWIVSFQQTVASDVMQPSAPGWKAGVARMVITPEQSMWMAGYGSRDHPSESTLHDLWAKAVALEDSNGKQAVLVTTDLLGFPKILSDRIRNRLESKYKLSRSQVILSSSHTHSGPVLQNALYDIYPLDDQERKKIEQYSSRLEEQIVSLVGKALDSMKPAKVFTQNGVTRFQVNRRNNIDSSLYRQTDLIGPNDYSVPVIKVQNETGELMAIVFGYACHGTVLSIYKWSGDYPGFAQLELERLHPGVIAMFFQGGGADMNPLPRRTIALAQQYGLELAAAVERVLNENMQMQPARLSASYSEVELLLAKPPGKDELLKISKQSTAYEQRWAMRLLDQMGRGEPFITKYPYPVEAWMLGNQPILILGGELVIDYTIQLKRIYGQNIFVMGYCNDVMAYIPSVRVLREGGYEVASSMIVYGMPSTWRPSIETLILSESMKVAEKAGVPEPVARIIEK